MRLLRFLGLEIVGATETRRLMLSTRVLEPLLAVTGLVGPFEVRETCVWGQWGRAGNHVWVLCRPTVAYEFF